MRWTTNSAAVFDIFVFILLYICNVANSRPYGQLLPYERFHIFSPSYNRLYDNAKRSRTGMDDQLNLHSVNQIQNTIPRNVINPTPGTYNEHSANMEEQLNVLGNGEEDIVKPFDDDVYYWDGEDTDWRDDATQNDIETESNSSDIGIVNETTTAEPMVRQTTSNISTLQNLFSNKINPHAHSSSQKAYGTQDNSPSNRVDSQWNYQEENHSGTKSDLSVDEIKEMIQKFITNVRGQCIFDDMLTTAEQCVEQYYQYLTWYKSTNPPHPETQLNNWQLIVWQYLP